MRNWINLVESAEAQSTITLWHGGRNLETDYDDVIAHKKGNWQHGPGLYLTTHCDTASKYAKGGGKLYRVTIRRGTDMRDVQLSLDDIQDFVSSNVMMKFRKELIRDCERTISRVGHISAENFVNLILYYSAISNAKSAKLRQFLIQHGVDYHIVTRYGGRDETVVVVVNPKIIRRVEIVSASDVPDDQRVLSPDFH